MPTKQKSNKKKGDKKRHKRPQQLQSQKKRRVKGIESRIDDLLLKGQKFRVAVDNPLDATLERTIEGASTIRIGFHDPDMRLLRHKMLDSKMDVELDGLWFRVVNLSKTDDSLEMTFEDRPVSKLRKVTGKRKAYRDKTTRAEFILSQVREVKGERIPVHIPKLHKERPIEDNKSLHKATLDVDEKRGKGLDTHANLTVKGVKADASQLRNADASLRVAASHDAPEAAMVALIAAEIVESTIRNVSGGDASSVGILQLLSMHGSVTFRMDIGKVVAQFLTKGFTGRGGAIALAKRGMDAASIAQAVQGAASPTYGQYIGEARKFVAAFHGGGIAGATLTTTESKRYAFERKANEDAWDCTGRLAEEVQFRRFMSAGVFYYVSEEELIQQRPFIYIDGDTDGIDTVNFDWDANQKVQEAQITGRVKEWAAPPGTVAKLTDDFGPAAGRYVVSSISSSLFDDEFSAILKKPMDDLPEPAPETEEQTTSFGEGGSFGKGGGGSLSGVSVKTSAGAPHWGGSADIQDQFVIPFMKKQGLAPGSRKRGTQSTASGGVSDHWTGATLSDAIDFGTMNGEAAARKLAKAMGNNSWQANSYGSFNIKVDGHTYRVQILWGASIDHDDHVHVGIKLVS